ncbi:MULTISPECIES: TspO/MBR family protein [unclassified Xanthobacter]|uniref:TspO/MBR family protein n=1 Tax=unclassified Xanthobacter TaxID=2623496 RepID=UPI001EDF051F|nr:MULTISPECIES: TspO/MBR family protein [unclassified Xanthobacter]
MAPTGPQAPVPPAPEPPSPTARRAGRLALCAVLVTLVAISGAVVTRPAIPGWYAGLEKPAFTPPNWAFPVAWTLLYAAMALALWRLWERPPSPARRRAILLFMVQLALNAAWSPVFFGLHALQAALVLIGLLVVALAATVRAALAVDGPAAALLLPYLAWVCYAASLNAMIAHLN